ncbi:helix-turn-helix domain-containing protein [Anaerotruncus rubiinfantis]|uniref:helix-turn-helix domain-containing protein n=1 Tax=Anaerotruncus rubiinfantis TaxID=1720200 RepID=UPI0011C7E935|nr:helix-turn-helix transcriptional regulator [Anaerotruncus rubiinfantis]
MRVGERVFQLLKEKGRKQSELANFLNVTYSTVNGWRQPNRNPSSDLILPICEFFDVSPNLLLTGKEKSSSPLRDDELELLQYYNALPVRDQGKILGQLAELTKGAAIPREGTA